MVIREFYKTRKDGVNLYRNYSDLGVKLKQVETNIIYNEAIDTEDSKFTYIETEEKAEKIEEE